MSGQAQPPWDQFRQQLLDMERRLRALETQQTLVWTDPTGTAGDPNHSNAVVVLGNLKPITGITGFGLAVWNSTSHTGAWAQIL